MKRIAYTVTPYTTVIRLLGVVQNPANGFPARPLGHQVSGVLYVSLFFVGVGGVVGTYLPAAAAVNNWFVSRRAMAMAVLSLPLVMVGFFFESLRSSVEIDPRTDSLTVAAIVLVLTWPLSKLIRNRPEDHDQHPDGIAPGHRRGPESDPKGCGDALAPNYAWREALRTRAFWLLVVGGAVFSVSSGGLFFNAFRCANWATSQPYPAGYH